MRASRLNLCGTVRSACEAANYSTVAIVNAVNAELASKVALKVATTVLGDGKVKDKGYSYAIRETTTAEYTGKMTLPLLFDAWHSGVGKLQKIAPTPVQIPRLFHNWLDKFAKAPVENESTQVENESTQVDTKAPVDTESTKVDTKAPVENEAPVENGATESPALAPVEN